MNQQRTPDPNPLILLEFYEAVDDHASVALRGDANMPQAGREDEVVVGCDLHLPPLLWAELFALENLPTIADGHAVRAVCLEADHEGENALIVTVNVG